MTRSIKDLRELVCVSRLTMREPDEDDLSRPMTSLSLFEESPCENQTGDAASSDIGLVAREGKNINNNAGGMSSIDFLKNGKWPLPPVGSNSRPFSGGDQRLKPGSRTTSPDERQGYFDDVLKCIGDDSTSDWLTQANRGVAELTEWCRGGENFVDFTHFWLSEIPLSDQVSLLKLEIGIILEEVGFSLRGAIDQQKLHESDVKGLFSSLFPEYPERLCSPHGQYIFLNILDTLSSGKDERYRRLLTDVRLATSQADLAQRALALRAYIVISIWCNIVKFYKRIKVQLEHMKSPSEPTASNGNRLFQAVRKGHVRALHYFLRNSFGSPSSKDSEGRTLAFLSVLHNQPLVLKYLIAKHPGQVSLNDPCCSGNTSIHVAANLNHTECLQLLLASDEVDVNQGNSQCEGATPLHLAVMQGNEESAKLLLDAGASRELSVNGVTPLQLAEQLGLEDMKALLLQ